MTESAENKVNEEDEKEAREDGKIKGGDDSDQRYQGRLLYGFMHLVQYTGFYRTLPTKDFMPDMTLGYLIELIFTLIPTLCFQVANNYYTAHSGLSLTPL